MDIARSLFILMFTCCQIFYLACSLGLFCFVSVPVWQASYFYFSGRELDGIARQPLWSNGFDYRHDTGTGIGHFLFAEEGKTNYEFVQLLKCRLFQSLTECRCSRPSTSISFNWSNIFSHVVQRYLCLNAMLSYVEKGKIATIGCWFQLRAEFHFEIITEMVVLKLVKFINLQIWTSPLACSYPHHHHHLYPL